MSDDFDDDKTPERRPLNRGERQAFDAHYKSGVPSVNGDYDHEDTSPIDLFERAPRSASQDLVTKLKRHPEKLIPFLGEFVEWSVKRHREQSSNEQSAMAELRELLNKPPNGAVKAIEQQVAGQAKAIAELAERMDELERLPSRIEPIEGTIKGVRAFSKWAISGLITAVLGSAVGIIATLQARAKEEGAAAERSAQMRRDLDELKARLNNQDRRPSRRDYDYDIAPKKEP